MQQKHSTRDAARKRCKCLKGAARKTSELPRSHKSNNQQQKRRKTHPNPGRLDRNIAKQLSRERNKDGADEIDRDDYLIALLISNMPSSLSCTALCTAQMQQFGRCRCGETIPSKRTPIFEGHLAQIIGYLISFHECTLFKLETTEKA